MDENNTQQPGGFPNTTGYVNPQQPDTTGYMNPPQSDMTGYANPQQPDMTGYYGQQPGQPDMTGYYGQQPVQPDATGYYGQQPVQPDMNGYYGQQPVQPDMTGYYGQQSMQPQTGGKKPKKPMTKGKLGALIGAGVAIVALVVCGVIFLPKLFKSDKEVVLDAMEETFSSYSTGGERNDVVGFDEVMKAYNEKGGDSSLNLTFNAGEGENAYAIGWNQNNAVDQKNKKLSADGAITIGGDDLLSYEVFGDEDTMTVGIPELLAGYLVYPADDPMGALANSPAGQSLGLDASALTGYSLNAFASGSDGSGLTSGYVSALETIWDAAEFKKQGSAKITVNGENVTAKEYYVTWAKEDLQDACVSAIDGLTEAVTGSQDTLDQLGMSADDYTYYMDQLKAAVPSVIKHDLCVKVYVKGKRAVKITCSDKINILNMVKIDYDFWLDAGKDDLSGNLSFDVSDTSVGVKFEAHDISGNTIVIRLDQLSRNLDEKADWMMENIRRREWVKDGENGWFNGYYDDHKRPVERAESSQVRMMLTSQVFAIMSKTAQKDQIESICKSVDKYLFDRQAGGYRLNTNFHEEKFDLGRMFGFAYGEKENGAVFSHMAVMYGNALYKNGYAKEGHKVLETLLDAAMDFENSRMYPGIPEYFDNQGRGLYAYLTGAASWYMLTMITEVFGVRGDLGDLVIAPALMPEQYNENGQASLTMEFAGRKLEICICNPEKKLPSEYKIKTVWCDEKEMKNKQSTCVRIDRELLEKLSVKETHRIKVELM